MLLLATASSYISAVDAISENSYVFVSGLFNRIELNRSITRNLRHDQLSPGGSMLLLAPASSYISLVDAISANSYVFVSGLFNRMAVQSMLCNFLNFDS